MTTIRVIDVHFAYGAGGKTGGTGSRKAAATAGRASRAAGGQVAGAPAVVPVVEEALKGISLELSDGLTAIIGQNGAGKTTFVRLLNGLLKPTSGRVEVDGRDTRDHTVAEMAHLVGLVFQNPNDQIFRSRTLDEVMFGPKSLGVPEAEARRRAQAALEMVGLAHATPRNPYDFGLADRKLISIASVIAMDTPVVVLDEPTIAQDHRGVEKVKAIVRELGGRGKLVITITHDMDFVAEVFDRTIVFRQGLVAADGPTRDIFGRPDLLEHSFVEEPHVTRLGRAVGLDRTVLTVEEFVGFCGQTPRPPDAQ